MRDREVNFILVRYWIYTVKSNFPIFLHNSWRFICQMLVFRSPKFSECATINHPQTIPQCLNLKPLKHQEIFIKKKKKCVQILWGLALNFLIMRQDVTDYKFELNISVCMLVNFEFRILTWNFEFRLNFKFWFWIKNFDFKIRILILNFSLAKNF